MSEPGDSFERGVYVGIASTAVLVHVWLAFQLAPLRATYAEFGAPLPALTSLAVSPYWLWGIPLVGAVGVGALAARRPKRKLVYALAAAALVLLAIASWRWGEAPLRDVASAIR
jgi:hypothetical protein